MKSALELRLQQLGAQLLEREISRAEYRRELMLLLAEQFGCHRVSLWRAADALPRRLSCVASLLVHDGENAASEPLPSETMHEDDWKRLVQRGVLLRVGAEGVQLHAALSVNGRVFGQLRCRRFGGAWSAADTTLLRRIAARVSLTIARYEASESLGP